MNKSQTIGRIFVGISLVVFGVQHFIYGGFVATLVPAWMPRRLFWAYFVGVAFFAAAVGIVYKLMARAAATMLGLMFFLFVVLLHIPRIIGNSSNGNEWTSGFVALAMCGGAWILASAGSAARARKSRSLPHTRAIFLCHGICSFRGSTFCLRALCGRTGSAVVSRTTSLGVFDWSDPGCCGCSDPSWRKNANRGQSSGNNPFSVLPAAVRSSHHRATAQSGAVNQRIRDFGSEWSRFGPCQHTADGRTNHVTTYIWGRFSLFRKRHRS